MRRRVRKLGLGFLVLTTLVLVSIQLLAFYGPHEMFTVRKIVVEGNHQADAERIVALAGAKTGDDLLEADLRAIAARVRRHPWVAKASVSRSFPSTLRIRVTERRPLALVAAGEVFVLDDRGVLLPNNKPRLLTDLPVLTGLSVSGSDVGKPLRGEAASALLVALRALRARHPELAARVSELRWRSDLGVVAMLVGSGTEVVLGEKDFGARLDRLAAVLEYLDRRRRLTEFRCLDARFAGQVVGKHRFM